MSSLSLSCLIAIYLVPWLFMKTSFCRQRQKDWTQQGFIDWLFWTSVDKLKKQTIRALVWWKVAIHLYNVAKTSQNIIWRHKQTTQSLLAYLPTWILSRRLFVLVLSWCNSIFLFVMLNIICIRRCVSCYSRILNERDTKRLK